MSHVADIYLSKGRTPERRNGQDMQLSRALVGGFYRNGCGFWGGGLCAVAACQRFRPRFVDSGPDVTPGNRPAASSGPWAWAVHSAAGYRQIRRCPYRSGRGATLQGTCCSGGRSMGRSARIDLHRDKTLGTAGRGYGGSLLVGQAWGNCRSQCGAGPLARGITGVGAQPRRCESTRRSALADRPVPLPRQTTRRMGGAP